MSINTRHLRSILVALQDTPIIVKKFATYILRAGNFSLLSNDKLRLKWLSTDILEQIPLS